MMLMRMRRKARELEKVKKLYRTATQKILPTHLNNSNHASATLCALAARIERSSTARRKVNP
jgi:hypothetical protein